MFDDLVVTSNSSTFSLRPSHVALLDRTPTLLQLERNHILDLMNRLLQNVNDFWHRRFAVNDEIKTCLTTHW